jgi:hypothetical protein
LRLQLATNIGITQNFQLAAYIWTTLGFSGYRLLNNLAASQATDIWTTLWLLLAAEIWPTWQPPLARQHKGSTGLQHGSFSKLLAFGKHGRLLLAPYILTTQRLLMAKKIWTTVKLL